MIGRGLQRQPGRARLNCRAACKRPVSFDIAAGEAVGVVGLKRVGQERAFLPGTPRAYCGRAAGEAPGAGPVCAVLLEAGRSPPADFTGLENTILHRAWCWRMTGAK